MRPVFMDQDPVFVVTVIGVPADVRAAVHDQHPLAGPARQPFRQHRAGKTRAHDQIIEAARLAPVSALVSAYTTSRESVSVLLPVELTAVRRRLAPRSISVPALRRASLRAWRGGAARAAARAALFLLQ